MSQERLNGLALLSIEKELVHKLDYSSLIETFAAKNARRVVFNNQVLIFVIVTFLFELNSILLSDIEN